MLWYKPVSITVARETAAQLEARPLPLSPVHPQSTMQVASGTKAYIRACDTTCKILVQSYCSTLPFMLPELLAHPADDPVSP